MTGTLSTRSVPRCSLLLPVRDAAPWLASSLASLARQTMTNDEVISVNDGSRDVSGALLDKAARHDPRIVVRHTPALGLPSALNLALSLARAPWVARQDADDVSHRERFSPQLAWLDTHPKVEVLGTRVRMVPAAATGAGMRRWAAWHNALLDHEEMRRELLIDSPLAPGTAMIRRRTLESQGGWQERGWAEDLDLWVRLFRGGAIFAKLVHPLYGWRQHRGSSTRTDERYSSVKFMALKIAALDAGLLRHGRTATLVGVGASINRWEKALGTRIKAKLEASRPGPGVVPYVAAPMVLPFMAREARGQWRRFLTGAGWRELDDFIFVA